MEWIVLGEKAGLINLTSARDGNKGLVPAGCYLTVLDDQGNPTYVLRVDESEQISLYNPTPILADLNLSLQQADRECKNNIKARKVLDLNPDDEVYMSYIKPQARVRLSTQEEIEKSTESQNNTGPYIFPASVQGSRSIKLRGEDKQLIKLRLPMEIYWHQLQVTGKTGSGKTVATKYLSEYFVTNKIQVNNEKKFGCVLAINVKDTDFLMMNQNTSIVDDSIKEEWGSIDYNAEGLTKYRILYSAHEEISNLKSQGVDVNLCRPITLRAKDVNPQALLGIVENLTLLAQQTLPDIFRYWKNNSSGETFSDFLEEFERNKANERFFTEDVNGRISNVQLNINTANAMEARLREAAKYFDNEKGKAVSAEEILSEGLFTVIDVASNIDFGSIVLSYLLNRIFELKTQGLNDVPILIVIDEVHQFYKSNAAKNALGILDTICRQGRSRKIGVIFSSQNISDIPNGLSSVINTSLKFKTDEIDRKDRGVSIDDLQSMRAGYCVSKFHGLPHLKVSKFPLSKSGVI